MIHRAGASIGMWAVLIAAVLVADSLRAQQPQAGTDEGQRAANRVAGGMVPPGVEAITDVEFAKVGDRSLKLDLYLPQNAGAGRRPTVVWIFGGAWQSGSRKGAQAITLANEGFAVASIDYRLSNEVKFPGQIQDCKAAIRWLRAHADQYNLDPDHIGAWGASSGGHLAALLGTSGGQEEFDVGENLTFSSRVQAVCDWFGPTDFLQMDANALPTSAMKHDAPGSPESRLIGGAIQEHPEKVKQANSITYVTPDDPPFLIMHGDSDNLVPVHQSQLLDAALTNAGVAHTFEKLPNSGHGDGAFRAPQSRQSVREFFKKHLMRDGK